MRYELADHEWGAIKPMLPNKLRGVPRVNDRRVFYRIKQYRRVATRYDRLAANDLSFVQLASIRQWRRLNEPAS